MRVGGSIFVCTVVVVRAGGKGRGEIDDGGEVSVVRGKEGCALGSNSLLLEN